MKNKIASFFVLMLLVTGLSAFATTPVASKAQMIEDWKRAKEYTKEYLDVMPEEGYGYKPTPEVRSFAEQMLHLANANYMFIATATGATSPVKGNLEQDASLKTKAAATKAVMESYDFVIAQLENMNEAQFGEKITLFGRFEMTREQALAKAFEHQTHHRGQTTIYIRMKGVAPPNEKLF